MNFDNVITCTDNKGMKNQFRYSIDISEEDGNQKWIFRVMSMDMCDKDWYEFAITQLNETIGKITVMDNRNMYQYRGKGITEKMIDEASKVLGLTICSSSNKPQFKSFINEWRTPAAETIWLRLIAKKKATYNSETDTYTYLNN